jgi:hypothetical protein
MLKEENDKNDNVENYIDSIINVDDDINDLWFSELNCIPMFGVKTFINYKLSKLKEMGVKIELVVSDEYRNLNISD